MDMSSSKLEMVQLDNRGSVAFQSMKKMHTTVVASHVFLPVVIRWYDYTKISEGFSQGVFYAVSFLGKGEMFISLRSCCYLFKIILKLSPG